MNRKDLIMVAVLINACLLVVLFFGALKREKRYAKEEKSSSFAQTEIKESLSSKELEKPLLPSNPEGSHIDRVLREYAKDTQQAEKKMFEPQTALFGSAIKGESSLETSPLLFLNSKEGSYRSVTVEKGDVLEKIARSNDVTVDEIMKLNQLQTTRLQIGQVLKLPPKKNTQVKVPLKEREEEGSYYIVKGGDNPWTIAQKNGIQVEELLRLNNIDAEKAKRLRPGDKLKIK